MNATKLRQTLATLGWSQREAAYQLGIAPRLMRYFAAGDPRYPIPEVVSLAMSHLVEKMPPLAQLRDKFIA